MKKKNNKWEEVIGCYGVMDKKGILNIFKNIKMLQMSCNRNAISFIVMQEQENVLVISNDHHNLGGIYKKNCKII